MSRRAITNALKARLAAVSLPKAWLNQDFDPAKPGNLPYLAVSIIRADTTDDTLDAEAPIQTGRIIASVVTARGSGDGQADDHADAVAALFPMGLRLTAGSQTITITQPPHVNEGLEDGAHWRVPVRIAFEAE